LTPLNVASSNGHLEVVKLLLEKGADPVVQDKSGDLLYITALNGHFEIVKLVLENTDDRVLDNHQTFSKNTLIAASYGGHKEIAMFLLDKGVSVDAHGEEHGTALQAAILTCSIPLVRLLLDRGADPAARDKHGWTSSMIAFQTGSRETRDVFGVHEYDLLSDPNECLAPSILTAPKSSAVQISSDGSTANNGMLKPSCNSIPCS
jgi:ankyrin repeat protein